jgi:hypothetical protein
MLFTCVRAIGDASIHAANAGSTTRGRPYTTVRSCASGSWIAKYTASRSASAAPSECPVVTTAAVPY